MSKLIIDLRSSFWFVPALVVLAAGALAFLAVELDGIVGSEALARYPRLFGAGAEGTRQLLSAIASSTITVAGVVFSITIVALSLTAAQYSPRVLRSFMRDRANQLVLGVFLGIYVYCLLVLRTIRGGENAFVPGISVLLAIVLALVGIAFLILFIHHMSTSIQATEITARVARETIAAIEAQFGRTAKSEEQGARSARCENGSWRTVAAAETGYIQSVNHAPLLEYARSCACLVRMDRTAGDFVVKGETLLSVTGDGPIEAAERLAAAFAVNTYRDIAQDPAFGVQQLVDIALKALSPGVNDTATARISLDYLTAILMELTRYRVEEEERVGDDDGGVLLIARGRSVASFVERTFEPIRRNSASNVDMLLHTLDALERVASCVGAPEWRGALSQQLGALQDTIEHGDYVTADRQKLTQAAERVLQALTPMEN